MDTCTLSCLILVPHHFRSIIFVDRKLARLNNERYSCISFWILSNVLSFLELMDLQTTYVGTKSSKTPS